MDFYIDGYELIETNPHKDIRMWTVCKDGILGNISVVGDLIYVFEGQRRINVWRITRRLEIEIELALKELLNETT